MTVVNPPPDMGHPRILRLLFPILPLPYIIGDKNPKGPVAVGIPRSAGQNRHIAVECLLETQARRKTPPRIIQLYRAAPIHFTQLIIGAGAILQTEDLSL